MFVLFSPFWAWKHKHENGSISWNLNLNFCWHVQLDLRFFFLNTHLGCIAYWKHIFKLVGNASRDRYVPKPFSVIFALCVGATPPTSCFEFSDTDFRKQLVELYKMYYSLFFFEKFSNLPKLFRAPIEENNFLQEDQFTCNSLGISKKLFYNSQVSSLSFKSPKKDINAKKMKNSYLELCLWASCTRGLRPRGTFYRIKI